MKIVNFTGMSNGIQNKDVEIESSKITLGGEGGELKYVFNEKLKICMKSIRY